jgi:hypothetical protein
LAVHTTAPLLVFGIATAIGLSGRASFLAAMLFLANPATFFLHSAMIPETLGILLFLAAWALVAVCARDERATPACGAGLAACLAGIVLVDHMSALVTALSFVVLALVTYVMREARVEQAFTLAAVSVVLLNGWLLLHATDAGEAIAALVGRVDELLDTVRRQAEMRGELFATETLPVPERLVGHAYPVVLLSLCFAGTFVLLRRRRRLAVGPLSVALLILGPGLLTVGVLSIVGGASELAARAWPFAFLGVALCAALGARLLDVLSTIPHQVRQAVVVAIVGVVMAGGIVVGDNVGGRFPRQVPASAAGPESVTDAPIAAARWFLQTTGRDHALVGDLGSELVFGTFGEQQPVSGQGARPFVAKTSGRIGEELERLGASYVVIDRRISLLPPHFGYYFGPEELAGSNRASYDQPFPLAQLDKLNRVRALSLIYDNGTTAVYGPAALAVKPSREP